jgi:oxygen-independent coproporphyrinogen-3 oxidase
MGLRDHVLGAMRKELAQRKGELASGAIGSIYFGGGTPSLLTAAELAAFLEASNDSGTIDAEAEVTLEANPDDVTAERCREWRSLGITRISLGTQSFRDERLQWMGRAHDSEQAVSSIGHIAAAGFRSWTIDLIYGLPGMTLDEWDEQLNIAIAAGTPHLSAYCLTIEERTALGHQARTGKLAPIPDGDQAVQFDRLVERLGTAGMVQYEISNFGRPGHFAVHNTNYWRGVPYVGIGPGAHSFNGAERRWNVANNARYAQALEQGAAFHESESLTPAQRVNERLMTGLRTLWGVELSSLGDDVLEREAGTVARYREQGLLIVQGGRLLLTPQGRRFADRIASDLFLIE